MEYFNISISSATIIAMIIGAIKFYSHLDKAQALSSQKDAEQDKCIQELKEDNHKIKRDLHERNTAVYKKMDEHYRNLGEDIRDLRNIIIEKLK